MTPCMFVMYTHRHTRPWTKKEGSARSPLTYTWERMPSTKVGCRRKVLTQNRIRRSVYTVSGRTPRGAGMRWNSYGANDWNMFNLTGRRSAHNGPRTGREWGGSARGGGVTVTPPPRPASVHVGEDANHKGGVQTQRPRSKSNSRITVHRIRSEPPGGGGQEVESTWCQRFEPVASEKGPKVCLE
jgi:hypothetical protein